MSSDNEVVESNDAFDAVEYNPIDHLNALFANPASLSSVHNVTSALKRHQDALDRTIAKRRIDQRRTDASCISRMQEVQSELSGLFAKIDDVQSRAEDTEKSITVMTAEIKKLDATKRNLTKSMTTLKRLQMLTSAYEQLRALKSSHQYKECAGLLAAVLQLMAHFKSYRSISQIAELSKSVADLQRELLEQICEDFELAFARGEVQNKRATLLEACAVVESMGEHSKQRLINWYCNTQLREYRQVFRGSEEAGSLDNISRRYSWFNRILRTYDAEHAVLFPKEWIVNEMLANAFCESTRDDYKGILQRSMRRNDGLQPDVKLLLSCLQETLDFEYSLERRFGSGDQRTSLDSQTSATKVDRHVGFSQAISTAFEPYLGIWIESQDSQLAALLSKYRQQAIRNSDEEFHTDMVISSSTELFNAYRTSFAQCAKLSTGARLLELSKTFARYLDLYCQYILMSPLAERVGTPSPAVLDVIIILNTADYCRETTIQLEERIKSRVDEEYKDKVDFQSQADAFTSAASSAVRVLVRRVESDCESAWREMRNVNWTRLQNVGDQSTFISLLVQRLVDGCKGILGYMQKPQYVRAFLDNLVDGITQTYTTNIISCRPISDSGAEQMLLDSYALKSGMLGLSSVLPASMIQKSTTSSTSAATTSLVKRVNNFVSRLDPLLKTLQVHASPPEAFVQAYLIHIRDQSETNFRKILELKGIRSRNEVNTLIDVFKAISTQSPNDKELLQANPIISSLDVPLGTSKPSLASTASFGGSAADHLRSLNLSALGMSAVQAASSSPNLTTINSSIALPASKKMSLSTSSTPPLAATLCGQDGQTKHETSPLSLIGSKIFGSSNKETVALNARIENSTPLVLPSTAPDVIIPTISTTEVEANSPTTSPSMSMTPNILSALSPATTASAIFPAALRSSSFSGTTLNPSSNVTTGSGHLLPSPFVNQNQPQSQNINVDASDQQSRAALNGIAAAGETAQAAATSIANAANAAIGSVSLNENFKSIGKFFRRDGSRGPFLRRTGTAPAEVPTVGGLKQDESENTG